MDSIYRFPFGQPLNYAIQADRTPKPVFVLGVYASAVHARWIGPDKTLKVQALAVASEPSIFWCGEDASEIIKHIDIPSGLGHLEPAGQNLNGLQAAPLTNYSSTQWVVIVMRHGYATSFPTAA